jgi:hypothetical protein
MVPRDLERRLQTVEIEQTDTITRVWIELSDGMIRGRRGETITRDAFKLVCSGLPFVVILPDNGRDPTRP